MADQPSGDSALGNAEQQLENELAVMAALQRAALRLLEAPDEPAVVALVLDALVTLQRAPIGIFYAREGASGELRMVAHHGLSAEQSTLVAKMPLEHDTATELMTRRGPVSLAEIEASPILAIEARRLRVLDCCVLYAAPLETSAGELIGIAVSYFSEPRGRAEREERLIDLHTRQAAAIIARLRTERALERSEETFRQLVQNIRDYAIYMIDPEGHVLTWNVGGLRLKGWSAGEVVGRHFRAFYTPEDQARQLPERSLAIAAIQGRYEGEGLRMRKDGSCFWGNEVISAMRAKNGRLIGFAKISRDLSERKAFEDALRKSEERRRLIIESIRDYAVVMIDMGGAVVSWNQGAEAIFGYRESEIVGQSGAVLFLPEDRACGVYERELQQATGSGSAADERWHVRKDGTRFWASGITSTVRDGDGSPLGFVKVCRDLTELRQVEEQRRRLLERERIARREAERAVNIRDSFVAVVSHELRTPLAAILLWARLLRSGAVRNEHRELALQAIEQSAAAQQTLIEDLLDMGRTMSGKMELRVRDTDPLKLVRAAIDAVAPMAAAKGIEVVSNLDEAARGLRGDPDRIRQVLWNIVQNAVKFTDRGGRVTVTLRQGVHRVIVQVADTGRGISAEFLPHVFEMFRQADSSTTRSEGGLGLGLAISRHLVELHGGSLVADSMGLGRGTTFTITLPISEPAGVEQRANLVPAVTGDADFEVSTRLEGLGVLVVEDEPNTRDALEKVLSASGGLVQKACSADEGLATYERALGGRGLQALVVDLAMPQRDGFQLMRDVRELERARGVGPARLVALTAYASEETRERAMAAGADAHLVKPIDPSVLVQTLLALTGRT